MVQVINRLFKKIYVSPEDGENPGIDERVYLVSKEGDRWYLHLPDGKMPITGQVTKGRNITYHNGIDGGVEALGRVTDISVLEPDSQDNIDFLVEMYSALNEI